MIDHPKERGREGLEAARSGRLAALLGRMSANPFHARKLAAAGVDPGGIRPGEPLESLLARLPFTTKAELQEDQERHPPFGTNRTEPLESYTRIHHTSGTTGRPLWWLDTREGWEWFQRLWGTIYEAAGVTAADRILFPFSFGPFIGFWAAFESAARLGCLVIPGGGMTTAARLRVLLETGATAVAATPTYALRMVEVAREEGIDLARTPVRALIVAGEPGGSVPATKERIESAWGARCFDHAGMTEVGSFGYECLDGPGSMHVLEDDFIAEVIDPASGARVPEGSEGELVITNLGRPASPAIRYRTGDLVRWTSEPCPCGSLYGRLQGGILARIDDMLIIRGNNVYPSAVEAVIRRFPEVAEFRIRAERSGELAGLRVEVEPAGGGGPPESADALRKRVATALAETFFFRSEVTVVPRGTLPRFELKGRRFVKDGPSPAAPRGAPGKPASPAGPP
jgi:phenylacetate-CoA ligase